MSNIVISYWENVHVINESSVDQGCIVNTDDSNHSKNITCVWFVLFILWQLYRMSYQCKCDDRSRDPQINLMPHHIHGLAMAWLWNKKESIVDGHTSNGFKKTVDAAMIGTWKSTMPELVNKSDVNFISSRMTKRLYMSCTTKHSWNPITWPVSEVFNFIVKLLKMI